MGAWGITTFENDKALDWLADFKEAPSEQKILETFSPLVAPPKAGFFSKLFGRSASGSLNEEHMLAAAEVVATLGGQPSATSSEDLRDLPSLQISKPTIQQALAALDSILISSELKTCWEDAGEGEAWARSVADIRQRLATVIAGH